MNAVPPESVATVLRVGPWSECGAAAARVRTAVFVVEQGIDPTEEWDADDARATHAVLFDERGTPLATIPGSPPDLAALPPGCAFAARCPRVTDACRRSDPPLAGTDHPVACFHPH